MTKDYYIILPSGESEYFYTPLKALEYIIYIAPKEGIDLRNKLRIPRIPLFEVRGGEHIERATLTAKDDNLGIGWRWHARSTLEW